jgi:hypothetical protein
VARMPSLVTVFSIGLSFVILAAGGCMSPYHTDQGAMTGGLLGLGTGALAGHALGNTVAGAAIGTGVGALAGAAIGSEQDKVEAQNRALIAQQLGRQVAAGSVSVNDVIGMSKAGVHEELILNHIRANGMAAPLQSADLILLQQQGVSPRVIAQMQASPPRPVQPVVVQEAPPQPVIVESYPYYGPYYGPRVHAYYRWH